MGNYLLSLRAPPPSPEEDERSHPLYYDWTIPKWSPFLETQKAEKSATGSSRGADNDKKWQWELITVDATRDSKKDIDNKASKAIAKQVHDELKDRLTSTIDTNSTKPANMDTHRAPPASATKGLGASSGSLIAKSTQLHKNTNANGAQVRQQSAKALKRSDSTSNIKRVDQMRPHTVDPKKYGSFEDAAAIKAATNIHAIKVVVKKSSS